MAKEKTSRRRGKPTARPSSLAGIRAEIDRLDRDILKLANQRAELALEIGKVKAAEGQAVYSPGREEEVLSGVQDLNPGPLSADCVRAIFRELISGSRSLEKELRVAYLGPAYT
ncbi:MAG: chorismate mutase, partial [Planctomycetaceae bacterium]|nr:chorismate mutase [Planctomycetaceae bacterium]